MIIENIDFDKAYIHFTTNENEKELFEKATLQFHDQEEFYELIIYSKDIIELNNIIRDIKSSNSFQEIQSNYKLRKVEGNISKLRTWVIL